MANEMSWKECVEQRILIETQPDEERSKQMLKMADLRLTFWDSLDPVVDEKYTSLFVETYYDVIKELIFAHLYKNGFNCTNHLCLIAYLNEKIDDFDFEIQKINELRQVRNEISYRGLMVKNDYLERNKLELKNIIKRLKEELEK